MRIYQATRQLFFISALTIFCSASIGQNCFCISGTKNKEKGTETIGGLTNSKEFYSLLFQKEFNRIDTTIKPKYILFLNAASRFLLNDSMLNTLGTMKLKLLDNSVITYDSVLFKNNPLGFCCTLGFTVYLTEEQIKVIANKPIVLLTVLDSWTTSFKEKRQREQQKIINCLISRQ